MVCFRRLGSLLRKGANNVSVAKRETLLADCARPYISPAFSSVARNVRSLCGYNSTNGPRAVECFYGAGVSMPSYNSANEPSTPLPPPLLAGGSLRASVSGVGTLCTRRSFSSFAKRSKTVAKRRPPVFAPATQDVVQDTETELVRRVEDASPVPKSQGVFEVRTHIISKACRSQLEVSQRVVRSKLHAADARVILQRFLV
jgi:hypothetical protein